MTTSKTSKVSAIKFDVEKFDGKLVNFGMWQCQMRDVLIQQELHKALLGVAAKTSTMTDVDWEEYDLKASSTIRLHLPQNVIYYVMREKSAASIWKILEEKYMTKSIENRLYLKKKLFRFEYARGTSMSEHVDEFNKMISDLLNLNEDMKDEDKAILLLNSLPESYDHLSTTLLYGKDSVKYEDVSSALLGNEQRQREKCSTSSDALVTRGRTDDRKQAKHNNSRSKSRTKYLDNMECYKCKRKGHMKKNCPNAWVDKGKKKNADDTANSVTSGDDNFESMLVVTLGKAQRTSGF
ncbi:hypothetical protein LguiB_014173 [Lonicera macranthoides]